VDPRKAEGKRLAFTIAAAGDPRIRRVELRNSLLVISDADSKAPVHVDSTRRELAEFVLGKSLPAKGRDTLAQLDYVLDRSQLMPLAPRSPTTFERKGKVKYSDDLEH